LLTLTGTVTYYMTDLSSCQGECPTTNKICCCFLEEINTKTDGWTDHQLQWLWLINN